MVINRRYHPQKQGRTCNSMDRSAAARQLLSVGECTHLVRPERGEFSGRAVVFTVRAARRGAAVVWRAAVLTEV